MWIGVRVQIMGGFILKFRNGYIYYNTGSVHDLYSNVCNYERTD